MSQRWIVSTVLSFGLALSWGVAAAASFELHLVKACGPDDKAYLLEGTTHEFCLVPDKVFDETGVVKAERYPVPVRKQ